MKTQEVSTLNSIRTDGATTQFTAKQADSATAQLKPHVTPLEQKNAAKTTNLSNPEIRRNFRTDSVILGLINIVMSALEDIFKLT